MNTLEALEARKSIRGYLSDAIEQDKLDAVLKAGNEAPKAGAFHMTVIRNAELIREIDQATAEAVAASGNAFLMKRFEEPGFSPTYGAPVLVVLSAPNGGYSTETVACAVTNMGVAAVELGLGTCYLVGVLMAFSVRPDLLERLDLPNGFAPHAAMVLGYPSPDQVAFNRMESGSNVSFVD